MGNQFNMFPENASTYASQVDYIYVYLLLVCTVVALGVVVAIVYFSIKYARNATHTAIQQVEGNNMLEITWSVIPLLIMLTMFGWGAWLYMRMTTPPKGALDFYVVGKQWMWKLQHPTGQREINELHVPVGRAVKLVITSEDTIHSFFVPAFRIKKDAVPGRYNTAWFRATRIGSFHLFCAEYCGTEHSKMIGRVVVMEPEEYQVWLAGGPTPESPVLAGEKLFTELNCVTCHRPDSAGRGPVLNGIFGRPVGLASGERVVADEAYVRESIMSPAAKVVAGYQPVMPTYLGQVSEEQLIALIAYIESLQVPTEGAPAGAASPSRAKGARSE